MASLNIPKGGVGAIKGLTLSGSSNKKTTSNTSLPKISNTKPGASLNVPKAGVSSIPGLKVIGTGVKTTSNTALPKITSGGSSSLNTAKFNSSGGYVNRSGGSNRSTQSSVNLQTPTIIQARVPSITAPRSTVTNSLSSSGLYQPTAYGTKTITPTDITQPFKEVPIIDPDTTDYNAMIEPYTQTAIPEAGTEPEKNALQQYMEEYAKLQQPDTADIYNDARRESRLSSAEKTVNDLAGQLNAVTARSNADQLSLVGQGRGIPEGIIGGQQAQIAREAAIASLPISAQLQAAQGNLAMAQETMNTLFKIKSDQAEREYNNNLRILDVAYQYASEKEKAELAKKAKEEERYYQEEKDRNNNSTKMVGDLFGLLKDGTLDQETVFKYAGAIQDGSMSISQVYKQLSGSTEPTIFDALEAISSIESSGNYQATSIPSKNGDRAYGRYQIMGRNIPSWSKEVLGQSISIQDFLANPQYQDMIAASKLQDSKDKFGTWEDAASVWFTGKPLATAGNPSDIYGTTNSMYQDRFSRALYKNVQTTAKKSADRPFGATLEAIAEIGNAPDKTKQRNLKQLQDYVDNKDYKSAYQLSINRISDNLPSAEEKRQFSEKLSGIPAAENLKEKLAAYQNAGGKTGLLKGSIESITNKLGNVKDPKYMALATELKMALQEYRQKMSGAAFSEQEAREYASVNPAGGKSFALNTAILDGMINSFKRSTDATIENKAPGLKYIREYAQYQGMKPDDIVITYAKRNPAQKSYIENEINLGTPSDIILEVLGLNSLINQ